MRRARGAARVGSVQAHYAGAGSLKKGTRRTRGREIRQRRRAGGSRDIFCETPARAWVTAPVFFGLRRARGLPGGMVGAVPSKRRVAGTPPASAVSRAPAPAPVVACVEAYYGSRRGAVVRARDVSLETEARLAHSNTHCLGALYRTAARVPRRRQTTCAASTSVRLLSRVTPSAAAGAAGAKVRVSTWILPRCRRDARDPILSEEAHRALPRRHAPPQGRRAGRLAHGVAGHDVPRFPLAAAVAAAAGAELCRRRRP